jgi:hypothetical protein
MMLCAEEIDAAGCTVHSICDVSFLLMNSCRSVQ